MVIYIQAVQSLKYKHSHQQLRVPLQNPILISQQSKRGILFLIIQEDNNIHNERFEFFLQPKKWFGRVLLFLITNKIQVVIFSKNGKCVENILLNLKKNQK